MEKVISQEKKKHLKSLSWKKKIVVDDEDVIDPLSVAVNFNILWKLIWNWQARLETSR